MTKTVQRPAVQRKAASAARVAPARGVKLADEGIVVAIVAVTGVVDSVNDLLVPGCFTASLAKRRPKVVNDHEWGARAGRVLHVEEWAPGDSRLPKRTKEGAPWPKAAGALVATMQYNLATERGRESFAEVKFYAETAEAEFSIGYRVPEGKASKRADGVRVIFGLDLFEFSHVLFGAAPLTMALEVKSAALPALSPTDEVADDLDDDQNPAPPLAQDAAWDDDTKEPAVESKTAWQTVIEAKSLPSPTAVERKALGHMTGSYQERTRLVEVAARDLFEATYTDPCVCVVATFDAEVVVRVYLRDGDELSFVLPYTATAEGVELGTPSPVDLSLVAEPAQASAVEVPSVEEVAVIAPVYDAAEFARTVIDTFEAAGTMERKAAAAAMRTRVAEVLGLEAKSDQAPEQDTGVMEADEATITRETLPEGDWAKFRKVQPIEALRMHEPFTVQTREGVVECEDGWLAIDSDGYPYPIAAEEFDAVYAPVEDPTDTDTDTDDDPDDLDDDGGDLGDEEGTVTLAPEDLYDPDADEGPSDEAVEAAIDTENAEAMHTKSGEDDDAAPPAADGPDPAGDGGETVTLDPDEHFETLAELDGDDE